MVGPPTLKKFYVWWLPPPHQPKIEYFNIFTFEGGGAVQRIFWGGHPSNKIGKCRQKANSCRCKKCFSLGNIWGTRVLGYFPLLKACLCWQCFDKIRKYWGHIETARKKRKSKSWCWFLRLKQNFFLYFWRGTRTLVPQPFFGVFFLYYEPVCAGNALIKLGNIKDT